MSRLFLKDISKVYDDNVQAVYDFNLKISEKEFIVLVGPSGCGKSTILKMIAGIESITDGELYINDKLMNQVQAKKRDVAMVFQSYALYPHMNVYDNIAFGLKYNNLSKDEISQRVHFVSKLLEIDDILDKRTDLLSGGQQQRVSIGRAIAKNADILLMDEPLSNLDAKLRVHMRMEIMKLHKRMQTTTIYVTHDQIEAMSMADRMVVMNKGKIQQIGTPMEIYRNPANMFVASFIGFPSINFLKGRKQGSNFVFDGNTIVLDGDCKEKLKKYEGKEVVLGIRPEDVCIVDKNEELYTSSKIAFYIDYREFLGKETILYGTCGSHYMQVIVDSDSMNRIDQVVHLKLNQRKFYFFDIITGLAIN